MPAGKLGIVIHRVHQESMPDKEVSFPRWEPVGADGMAVSDKVVAVAVGNVAAVVVHRRGNR